MPEDWKNVEKNAIDMLKKISDLFLVINADRGVSSKEADIVNLSTDPVIDFFSDDSQQQYF